MNTFVNFLKQSGWLLAIILIICIGFYPYLYVVNEWPFGMLMSKSDTILKDPFWVAGFYLHIIPGSIALLSGWSQFIPKFRNKRLTLHRTLGKIYVASVLVSGLAGFYIAYFAMGGWVACLGFMGLALTWLLTTFRAYQLILNKEVEAHEQMMIYSYAACLAAVTLRLWLTPLSLLMGDFIAAYTIIAWLCWVPNMLVAHLIVRKKVQAKIQF